MVNVLALYGLTTPSKETENLMDQLGAYTYLRSIFKPLSLSDVANLDIGRAYEFSKNLFSTHYDEDVISSRQNLISDFKNIVKSEKDDAAIWHFISSGVSLENMVRDYPSKPESLSDLSSLYAYFSHNLLSVEKIFRGKKGLEPLHSSIKYVINNNSEIIFDSRFFKEKFPLLSSPEFSYNTLVTLDKEPKFKSKSIEFTPVTLTGGEADGVLDLFAESRDVFNVINLFYSLASYMNHMDKLELPISFPTITDNNKFEVVNGFPMASEFSYRDDSSTRFNTSQETGSNHFIYAGAHSGGKTHLLKTIGLYHLFGLSGLPLPCESSSIPLLNNITASIKRSNTFDGLGRGSLEAEIANVLAISNDASDNDLILIDEFLDTTKPELSKYLSASIFDSLDKSKSAIHVVYHAASYVYDNKSSFKFKHPELVLRKRFNDSYVYVPTYNFLEGPPDGSVVRVHSKQIWEASKKTGFSKSD